MEEKYTSLDGKANSASKINDTYSSIRKQQNSSGGNEQLYAVVQKGKPLKPKKTLGKGNNDAKDSIAKTPSSSVPESNEQQTTGFDFVGEGQLYDKLRQGRFQTSKKNVGKGDNYSAGTTAQTSLSSVPSRTKLQTTHNADRKWRKTKLTCAIITTLFALAGFGIAVVTLVELTSQAEIKQLTVRINDLEEQQQRADTKIMELNVSAESANTSIRELEVHLESTDITISNVEESLEASTERTNELEVTVQKNTSDLNNSVQECINMDTQLANQIAELEETVLKLHVVLDGYEYKLTNEAKSWTESRSICQNQGGDLATVGIRDATAREYIGEALLKQVRRAWIGLTAEAGKCNFVWVDGTAYTEGNPPWKSGEPNDDKQNVKCVGIFQSLEINDDLCNVTLRGICEIPLLF